MSTNSAKDAESARKYQDAKICLIKAYLEKKIFETEKKRDHAMERGDRDAVLNLSKELDTLGWIKDMVNKYGAALCREKEN